jgi:hypothetical protein
MRKWYLPLTVLGIGGLGVLLGSESGRNMLRRAGRRLEDAPDQIRDWSETYQSELQQIQATIDSLTDILKTDTGSGASGSPLR